MPSRRGYRKWASNLDMYRKVPTDLLEGTKRGSVISYLAMMVMLILYFAETMSYFSGSYIQTDVSLDLNKEEKVRVNFNITMLDLRCDYAVIDIVSPLGTAQNVTANVQKYALDDAGVKARYKGRNLNQNDILLHDHLVTSSIEELHEDGEDAISLDPETLETAKQENTYLFVDFFASWCSHCRDLAPTWEVLAEAMTEAAMAKVDAQYDHIHPDDLSDEEYNEALEVELPVKIAKLDCVDYAQLCFQQQIWAYPTLRLFIDGSPVADYKGDRTVLEMIHWLSHVEEEHKKSIGENDFKVKVADEIARETLQVKETREQMLLLPNRNNNDEWAKKIKRHQTRQMAMQWQEEEHAGCQLSGFLYVDRVPGNFHIQARSPAHDIAAHMTNVSHEIHHLSFGDPGVRKAIQYRKLPMPPNFEKSLSPMDGNVYVNYEKHESFHHYLKVVTTNFDDPYVKKSTATKMKNRRDSKELMAYQILSSSQLSYYHEDIVPEAKFSYDPSPIAVYHRRARKKHWYDYITSLMAIIGGTFTVIGMIENSIHAAVKKRR
mmetsp:Transcript_18124/g.22184  ORF Transcript_18124/g.22184 Transcript_18124/m.22184 type:complete len:548 (+) Transcript_18124:80-1723(+)